MSNLQPSERPDYAAMRAELIAVDNTAGDSTYNGDNFLGLSRALRKVVDVAERLDIDARTQAMAPVSDAYAGALLSPDPQRAAIVASIREAADWLEAHPDFPLTEFDSLTIQHCVIDGDRAEKIATVERIAKVLGAEVDVRPDSVAAVRKFGGMTYGPMRVLVSANLPAEPAAASDAEPVDVAANETAENLNEAAADSTNVGSSEQSGDAERPQVADDTAGRADVAAEPLPLDEGSRVLVRPRRPTDAPPEWGTIMRHDHDLSTNDDVYFVVFDDSATRRGWIHAIQVVEAQPPKPASTVDADAAQLLAATRPDQPADVNRTLQAFADLARRADEDEDDE